MKVLFMNFFIVRHGSSFIAAARNAKIVKKSDKSCKDQYCKGTVDKNCSHDRSPFIVISL